MENTNIEKVEAALADFVIRATQKDATPEDIAVLPGVAQALVGIYRTLIS